MLSRAFWSAVVVCALLPGEGRAQVSVGVGAGVGPYGVYDNLHGPRVAPWGYPGVYGPYAPPLAYGGYAGYNSFGYGYPGYGGFGYGGFGGFGYPGFYRYSGRTGSTWSNGLSLYGPPVPITGPIPGVFGNNDLVQQWRSTLAPGFAGPVWVGISVGPRPRYVGSIRPVLEPVVGAPAPPVPAAKVGGALILSVKVPQPAAEVFVDGRPTLSTGTDRTFESPALAAGGTGTYTLTARWVERGRVVEVSKQVTGTPGEVVRVDFTK